MKTLVDIVNFNADGSCLSAARWLEALRGGAASQLCGWLRSYVDSGCKVNLGFIGGTVADMVELNSEAIAIVNQHPEIFEVLVRPFAHDIALLRSLAGFRLNLEFGRAIITKEFRRCSDWYLPPEFMLTNRQLADLRELGAEGVFVNPARFEAGVQRRLPHRPYIVTGVADATLPCIPFDGALTEAYLQTLQRLSGDLWQASFATTKNDPVFLWRDGESVLLVPSGIEREQFWLQTMKTQANRRFLSEAVAETQFTSPDALAQDSYRSYPVHSFGAWMKEFRMLGYLRALEPFENRLATLSKDEQVIWLQAINSDVLSAVEKESPTVPLRSSGSKTELFSHSILRSERGFEGEDYLCLLESFDPVATRRRVAQSSAPHLVKLRARLDYFGKR